MNKSINFGKRKQNVFSVAKMMKCLFLCFLFSIQVAFAQVRPNINTLDVDPVLNTAQEQQELACLIKNYLDANPDFITMHQGMDIHSTANLFPWHRHYIGILEEYLTSIGMNKYVPLPKWDPNTPIPDSFFNGTCATATGYSPPANQTISSSFFANLSSTICSYTTRDALTIAVDGPHGAVHGNVGGAMCCINTSPGTTIFFLWHGYVDDVWKQWECTCPTVSPSIVGSDLYMKDRDTDQKIPMSDGLDMGYEPFVVSVSLDKVPIYVSEDIWVRKQDDGVANQTTENPEYRDPILFPGSPNYVYVRVRNRGCVASLGTERLRVYWSKASTGLSWDPSNVNNSFVNNVQGSVVYGDEIGKGTTITISSVVAGGQTIIKIPWFPPNPADFGDDPIIGSHVCLVARIERATTFPFGMTFDETTDLAKNVVKNNNIVWKNITVVDEFTGSQKMYPIVRNTTNKKATIKISFLVPLTERLIPFLNYGTVTVDLGKTVYDKWVQGGKKGSGIETCNFSGGGAVAKMATNLAVNLAPNSPPKNCTLNPYEVRITAADAFIDNISFDANEMQRIGVQFNYKPQPAGNTQTVFNYDITQSYVTKGVEEFIGGVRYNIHIPDCPQADAGKDISIVKGCSARLKALPLIVGAIYNWYDSKKGDLVGSGSLITVTPNKDISYKLEMILPNGCISYDEINVTVDQHSTLVKGCPEISGVLLANSSCGGNPVFNDTLLLIDVNNNVVSAVTPVVTESNGSFYFNSSELVSLNAISATALFSFITKSGVQLQAPGFNTIEQWITASPLQLTLKKLQASFANNTILCFTDSVHFTSILSEGFPPYTYNWSFGNGDISSLSNPVMKYATAGTYTVTLVVTDAIGCTATSSVTITQPDALQLTLSSTNSSCGNSADGSVNLTVLGGTAPYTYLWSNGATTEDLINLVPDTYTVVVTDANGCSGTATATLVNATTTYSVSSISYSPNPYRGGTVIPLGDDAVSGSLPIGFSFCFFGNSYTQFYAGSNGWISFSAGQTTAYRTVSIPDATSKSPKNVIMLPWQDLYSSGGKINYALYGTAPFRKLVVSYDSVIIPCSFAHGFRYYQGQVVLYETTNIIENYIRVNDNTCNSMWGTGPLYGVQGIQNLAGTVAVVVPGRNNAQWVSNSEGWQYMPGTASFKMAANTTENTDGIEAEAFTAINKDSKVIYYPNPATDELIVMVNDETLNGNYELVLTNLLGQRVISKHFTGKTVVDVSNIRPKGLYFIQIMKDGKQINVGKLVIGE